MKKQILILTLILALAITAVPASQAETASAAVDISEYFSKRDLAGAWDESEARVISLESSLEITEKGTYILSGEIANGTVTVNVGSGDKVQLVLSGARIASASSAALLVENADKVFVTLKEGTENSLTSTGFDESSDVDGAVFARDDIVFNGAGSLTVSSAKHGIVAKDDIKFTGGQYTITAQSKGIKANDSVRVSDGSFTIVSQKDAVQAKNDEDDAKGYVLIAGGEWRITAGGGAENGAVHADNMFGGRGQRYTAAADTDSAKGVKASGGIILTGGTLTVDAADDAIHSDADITVYGGDIQISTGDDGMHADKALTINGGNIQIFQSYEGLEASAVTINGGDISLTASDDGVNSSGGKDSSGWGWNDMFASDGSTIVINGGRLHVNASGDGIDSNGDLTVNGGDIVVSGPTNSGNGALDANGTIAIHGGTVIAASAVGMAETFGASSTQVSFLTNLSGAAGSEITVQDQNGGTLLSATVEKNFQCVVISSPDLQVGETYAVSSGSASVSVTPGSVSSSSGGMGGFGGSFGGGGFGNWGGGREGRGGRNQQQNTQRQNAQPQPTPETSVPPEAPADGMTPPEGLTPPEGMTFPDGMTPPDGMTLPEGMAIPDGMTPPDGGTQATVSPGGGRPGQGGPGGGHR